MSWVQTIAAVVGGGGVAGFLGSLLTGLLQRPKVKADAVATLTDSALRQVNELQERTAEAEREATGTRNDLAQARQQIRLVTAEVDALLRTLRSWRASILSPTADLGRLRDMVSADPDSAANGHRL